MSRLIAKIRRSLARDANLPLWARAAKARRYVTGSLLAPMRLRGCDLVGARTRVAGTVIVENSGRLVIGRDGVIFAEHAPVELQTAAGGVLSLGDDVHVNYGTSFRARTSVRVGDAVSIGPYCIIDDTVVRFEGGRRVETGEPIEIGNDVWLAARVTVLPGTRIGARSVITAGSIVSGEIPPGVVAGGIPARVLRSLHPDAATGATLEGHPSHDTPDGIEVAPAGSPSAAEPILVRLRGRVLADFTIGDFAVRLADEREGVVLEVVEAPYAQTTQHLLASAPSDSTDFLIVWTLPEIVSAAFGRVLSGERVSEEELTGDVDSFADLVARGAGHYRQTFVPTWVMPAHHRGLGMIDLRPGGVAWSLAVMNRQLMRRHETAASVFVLDAERWSRAASTSAGSTAKGWYLGKVPFSSELFAEAASDVKAAVQGLMGQARKLLVLDLDDTIWGGIVGDAGWENLQLGGHDATGEAFVDFQRAIKALTRRGIVLGIVSKNTEEVALEAIQSHPEMVLRLEDFVGWRINWRDKAQNIADLAAELNLGLQSVVFIDDNPVERARVRETLPEVFVPEWPEDKLQYVERFQSLRCFDAPVLSAEDADRTRLYAQERQRSTAREQVGSLDEWLMGLDIRVHADFLQSSNLARVHQLLNKTNQMNLATRRLGEGELDQWSRMPGHAVLAISVADRFGSAGVTGILSLALHGPRCEIVDFVLSCRVMGRRVEETMLHLAVEWARQQQAIELRARYHATKKNKPCHDFFRSSGLARDSSDTEFSCAIVVGYPLPAPITLEWMSAARETSGAS